MADYFSWTYWTPAKRWLVLFSLMASLTLVCFFEKDLVNEDGIYYLHIAKLLHQGNWDAALDYRDFPFVPGLIALTYLVIPDWVLAGQILMMLSMMLALVPFYALVRKFQDERCAFIAALFMAVSPSLRFNSINIARDSLFVLFFMTFLWAFSIILQQRSWRWYSLGFGALIFAGFCRLEGFYMLGAYVFFLVYRGFCSENHWLRRATQGSCILILAWGSIEIFSPYGFLNEIHRFKDLTNMVHHPQQFYENLAVHQVIAEFHNLEKTTPSGRYGGNIFNIASNYLPVLYGISLLDAWMYCAFPTIFFLGIIGFWKQWKNQFSRNDWALATWLIFLMIPPLFFLLRENHLSKRYVLPATLILYLWTGIGFYGLWNWIKSKIKWNIPNYGKAIFLAVLILIPALRIIQHQEEPGAYVKQAGQWIQQNLPQEEKFVTNEVRLYFYADKTYEHLNFERVTLPPVLMSDDPLALLSRARALGVKIIAIRDKVPYPSLGEPIKVFPGKRKSVYIYRCPE